MEEQKKEKESLSPVVKGKARLATDSEKKMVDKFHDAFIAEDIKDAAKWFWKKKALPGIKHGVVEFVDRVLNGGDSVTIAAKKTVRSSIGGTYVDYTGSYRTRRASDDLRESRTSDSTRGSSYRIGVIYVSSRAEAQEINQEMASRIEKYDSATVADLFSLCGITRNNHMDNKWGWTSAMAFRYRPSGDEWILDYDPPKYLGG